MFELQRHHYHLTCAEQVGWPTALWEHKLLPESGRPGNIGTQNPAGEPQSYQTLNRARLTQNMWLIHTYGDIFFTNLFFLYGLALHLLTHRLLGHKKQEFLKN